MLAKAVMMQGNHGQVIFDRTITGDLVVTVLVAGDMAWKPCTVTVPVKEKEYADLKALFSVQLPQIEETEAPS